MNAAAQNEEELTALENILRGGQFLTVADIARLMECSRPTAYGRVRSLKRRGLVIETQQVRQGHTGPKARAFAIVMSTHVMSTHRLTRTQRIRLAARSGCDERTIIRLYSSRPVRSTSAARIAEAAAQLGYPLPPGAVAAENS